MDGIGRVIPANFLGDTECRCYWHGLPPVEIPLGPQSSSPPDGLTLKQMAEDLDNLFASTRHLAEDDQPASPARGQRTAAPVAPVIRPPAPSVQQRVTVAPPPPSPAGHHSPIGHLLRSWTALVTQHPIALLTVIVLACVVCSYAASEKLGFKTKRADLINPSTAYHQRWLKFTEEFGDAGDLVVVVEGQEPAELQAAMNDLGLQLQQEPEFFSDVLYRVDTRGLQRKGLQYLPPEQLEQILTRLEEFSPVLHGKWNVLTLNKLFQGLHYQIDRSLQEPDGQVTAALQLELGTQLTRGLTAFLKDGQSYQSPWSSLWPMDSLAKNAGPGVRYNLNKEGTLGFILCKTVGDDAGFQGAKLPIERVRTLIQAAAPKHPAVQISLTGIPVLEYDEMRSSEWAMILESIVSYTGVGILLVLGFRGLRFPILALTMLGVATTLSFGLTTTTVGHLNILSVSFVAIVVGLGIDYAILYISKFLEFRQQGHPVPQALVETSSAIGPGILTAAATTSIAFFSAVFTDFLGVSELGLIAGGGILLCALAAFTFLPASLSLIERFFTPSRMPSPFEGKTLRSLTWQYPGLVTIVAWAFVGLIGGYGWRVTYDYNLMNLQADGIESVEVQQRIAAKSDNGLLFAVSLADTPQQALELKRKLAALPSVHHVDEIASALPSQSHQETELLVQGIQVWLRNLPDQMPTVTPVDPAAFHHTLAQLTEMLNAANVAPAQELADQVQELRETLHTKAGIQQVRGLMEYQQRIVGDLYHRFRGLSHVADPTPVSSADLPEALRHRFVGKSGKWLLQIYPREEIWAIEPLQRFIDDVRSVDPLVTGVPLQNFDASRQIRDSYATVAMYALFASYFILLLDFLSLRHVLMGLMIPAAAVSALAWGLQQAGQPVDYTVLGITYLLMTLTWFACIEFSGFVNVLLSLMPPLVGAVLTLGVLGLLDIPANLIILPLILGIGVDNGVHVMHDFRQQQLGRYQTSPSLINALFLTSMSNMAGFSSMILAAHRGLRSIGLVLTIGVGCCLFVSVVLLPAMLTLWSRAIAYWRGIEEADSIADGAADADPALAFDAHTGISDSEQTRPDDPSVDHLHQTAPPLSLYAPRDRAA